MVKRVKIQRQVAGEKEAPLVVIDSNTGQKQEELLSYYERELRHFRGLFQGFFEKFVKWQAVTDMEGYEVSFGRRKVEVFASSNGLYIAKPGETPDPEDKILEMQSDKRDENSDNPSRHFHRIDFTITPGAAGERLLVDLDGQPIKEAKIHIEYTMPAQRQLIFIRSTIPPDGTGRNGNRDILRGALYENRAGKFHAASPVEFSDENLHRIGNTEYMSDTYATHLISTIDRLIPGSASPAPQLGRRTRPETQAPIALLAPGRRRRPGR